MIRTTSLAGTVFALAWLAAPAFAGDPSTQEGVAECVAIREAIFACKEDFAEAFVAHHNPPPERRADIKKRALEEITADGSGPLEARQKACADAAKRGHKPPADTLQSLKKALSDCNAKSDCPARVACFMPVIKSMLGKGKSVKK